MAFTYNQAAQGGGKIDMGNFSAARVLDDRRVEITLSAPQSTFVSVLGSLGIVPQHQYDAKTYAQNPVGAGPYRLVSFQPGQQLIVEANPYYSGHRNDFDKLIFVFLDEDSAYAAAQSGQLGLVRVAPSVSVTPQQGLTLWVRPSVEKTGASLSPPYLPVKKMLTDTRSVMTLLRMSLSGGPSTTPSIVTFWQNQLMEGHAIPAYSAVQGLPWDNPQAAFKDGVISPQRNTFSMMPAGRSERMAFVLKTVKGTVNAVVCQRRQHPSRYGSGRQRDGETPRYRDGAQIRQLGNRRAAYACQSHAVRLGSLDPMELYHHYSSKAAGVEYYNPGYYSNNAVDQHLQQALNAPTWQQAVPVWQQVEWDGESGAGVRGDAAWAWLLNLQHTYLASPCIDLGNAAPEIHGSWSVLNNVQDWKWTCQ